MKYDFLVVGAGLYGAVFAQQAMEHGKTVYVIDKRNHIGGNVCTQLVDGIHVHLYGAHIFHTNDEAVWEYVNRFAKFNRYTNSPIAYYKGEIYSLPFNMYTFNRLWGVVTPDDAKSMIEQQREQYLSEMLTDVSVNDLRTLDGAWRYNNRKTARDLQFEKAIMDKSIAFSNHSPCNLEEQAISLVGKDIYEKLVKGYTEKQWGRACKDLPASIINRLPVRFTYDNNYFNAVHQGIPIGGYTDMVGRMLKGADVELQADYFDHVNFYRSIADKVIYTGPIDAYFDYFYGPLEYRSVRFVTERLGTDNFQGNAVVNYTDRDVPWTRIIEHKWFEFGKDIDGKDIPHTIISKEFSAEWRQGIEPYYPINDEKNKSLYEKYKVLADAEPNVIFGGRLGEYKYYDMDVVIGEALKKSRMILEG